MSKFNRRQRRRRRGRRKKAGRRGRHRRRFAAGPEEITIDGETFEVYDVMKGGYLPLVEADGQTFYVAEDLDSAGSAAAQRWRDMAENDPTEFRAMMGDEVLVNWALGKPAGPGSAKVTSLEEWLEVVSEAPEEEFASYDGYAREVEDVGEIAERKIGFSPDWAFRHN